MNICRSLDRASKVRCKGRGCCTPKRPAPACKQLASHRRRLKGDTQAHRAVCCPPWLCLAIPPMGIQLPATLGVCLLSYMGTIITCWP